MKKVKQLTIYDMIYKDINEKIVSNFFKTIEHPMKKSKREITVYEFDGYLEEFQIEVHNFNDSLEFYFCDKHIPDKMYMFKKPLSLDEEEIKREINECIDSAAYFYLNVFLPRMHPFLNGDI